MFNFKFVYPLLDIPTKTNIINPLTPVYGSGTKNELGSSTGSTGKDKNTSPSPTEKLFGFPNGKYIEDTLEPSSIVQDDIEAVDEPFIGIVGEEFNSKAYEEARNSYKIDPYKPKLIDRPPLIPPQHIPPHQILESLTIAQGSPEEIIFISIHDVKLSPKLRKSIGRMISSFPNVQILVLRNLGLTKLEFNLPKLRVCDLVDNEISNFSSIVNSLMKSPYIEVVNFLKNPISRKPEVFMKLIGQCIYLEVVNEKELTVTQRIHSIAEHGSKLAKANLSKLRYEFSFLSLPFASLMRATSSWQPENITELILRDAQLTYFNVAGLINLGLLDLMNNQISDTEERGLEMCANLHTVNLRNNLLRRKESLRVFAFVPHLKSLFLDGNKFDWDYVTYAIHVTRNLAGTNRSLGLQTLDGTVLTIEHRVKAAATIGIKDINPEAVRWNHTLIEYFGHFQMQKINNLFQRVKYCVLQKRSLVEVNLREMVSIEVLDLSCNDLIKIEGLEKLTRLRILNLSENPRLSIRKEILPRIAKFTELEDVSFFVNKLQPHLRNSNENSYRLEILAELLFLNPKMTFFDRIRISPLDRIEALRLSGRSNTGCDVYAFQMALLMNCTMPNDRQYHPNDVGIGRQYDPETINALRLLNNWNLVSDVCDFTKFSNLKELNLKGNKLVDICNMGLEKLLHIKVIDVHDNNIQTPLPNIARLLDSLSATLEVFAIRNNPCIKSPNDRLKLIGLTKSQRELGCVLKVMDSEITIPDRISGWRIAGGSPTEAEDLRFRLVVLTELKGVDPANVLEIDFAGMELQMADFGGYESLEKLILQNNEFTNVENIKGLANCKKLRILDLRNNQLKDMNSTAQLIAELPLLRVIGLLGNKFSQSQTYRSKFLQKIPAMWENKAYPMGRLDEEIIEPDEIFHAFRNAVSQASAGDLETMKFNIALIRRVEPNMSFDILSELDLSCCKLSFVDFTQFPKLRKLSIANNYIKNSAIQKSNIDCLQELGAVDLRYNRIKSLSVVIELIEKWPNLEMLYISGNPCYQCEDNNYRAKFFKKLKRCNIELFRFLNGIPISHAECEKINPMVSTTVVRGGGLERVLKD